MKRNDPPKQGAYLTLYLSVPLYDYIAEQARVEQQGLPGWIRDRLIDLCPPRVQIEARALLRSPPPKGVKGTTESKPKPEPPPPAYSIEDLVEKHRDRVREMEAKGYLPSYIANVLRIPYRVVAEVLSTKAQPKKGPRS